MTPAIPTGLLLYMLLIAPFVGSFLAVVADRLPRGESVVTGRSRCRGCDAQLAWRDLVPLLSWILRKGRCGTCGAAIPLWLLLSEVLAVLCVALAYHGAGGSVAGFVLLCGIFWLALALGLTDALWMRLPDSLVVGLLALALLRAGLTGAPDLAEAVLGAALGCSAFWVLRIVYRHLRGREGMGLGDVKLMAALGALVGPLGLAPMVLIAALLGLCWGIAAGGARATTAVPFGSALLLATVLFLSF